jgi:hypothetical protein
MTWGEAQSVIQLAAALNAIYLGLKDIRSPYVRREQQAQADQVSEWRKRAANATEILRAINDNQVRLTTTLDAFDRRDRHVGIACLAAVAVYVLLLICSAYFYKDEMSNILAFVVVVAGFVPIACGTILNIALVRDLESSVAAKRREIDEQFAELNARPAAEGDQEPGISAETAKT